MPPREKRAKPNDPRMIEYRAADIDARSDIEQGNIAGYLSADWVVDSYGTAFAAGAWEKSIRERADKFFLLLQHWPDDAIGKLDNVATDEIGLKHDSTIIDDGDAGTVTLKRLRGGVPFAHSVGFKTLRERPATDNDPLIFSENSPAWARENPDMVYVIEEAKLYEGSVVTFAANDRAIITDIRNDQQLQTLSDTLEALRAGRVTPAHLALIGDLAAVYTRHAAAGAAPAATTAPDATVTEADRRAALSIIATIGGLSKEQLLCAPYGS